MPDWKLYKYTLIISILSLVLIAIFSFEYLWPWATIIFIFELVVIILTNWLERVVKYKIPEKSYLSPGFVVYRNYFSIALTIYLIMGIFGVIEKIYATVYFSLFIIGLIGVSISVLLRIMVEGDLLDEYNDGEDEE